MSSTSIAASALFRRDHQPNMEECTFTTCDIKDSYYGYRPSLPVNAVLVAIFGTSLSIFVAQGLLSKRFIGFSIVMVIGTFGETLGYIGRIMMHNNPWKQVNTSITQAFCFSV